MCRVPLVLGAALLTASAFGQQQPDTTRNLNPDAYNRDAYNRPTEVRTDYGNWGLLGLLGLTGLLGLRRRETIVRGRDEYLNEQRRRVA
jgi:MYXO-CTERM domain-containing protein